MASELNVAIIDASLCREANSTLLLMEKHAKRNTPVEQQFAQKNMHAVIK